MLPGTRKVVDRAFSGLGLASILLLAAALVVLLIPIIVGGLRAFVFRATVEHRRLMLEQFHRGNAGKLAAELAAAANARQVVYDHLAQFEKELRSYLPAQRREYAAELKELKEHLRTLLGPLPGEPLPVMPRHQYGQTRWDRAQLVLRQVLMVEEWDYSDASQMGRRVLRPRVGHFAGTSLEPLFDYLATHAEQMLRPRWTFYWRFLTDDSRDAHFFGGIWPEVLGTLYLTIGAILFAVPTGIISAIYLVEYARENWLVGILRSCVSTLAGVPSIVFGLFGLAFFINTIHVSPTKSVLAGSLTLAALILPLVIRASEEALRAVPQTYKEAALSCGASRWRTIVTVLLPAALPGILT